MDKGAAKAERGTPAPRGVRLRPNLNPNSLNLISDQTQISCGLRPVLAQVSD